MSTIEGSYKKTRDAFLCMNCSSKKIACLYKDDDLDNCLDCRKTSKECSGPMSARDRRMAGVRSHRTVKVTKEVAIFIKEILEPLLQTGVTVTEVTDQLASAWDLFPPFDGIDESEN